VIGAIPVVKQIITEIGRLEGRLDIHWDEHFTIMHQDWLSGVDGRFLSLLSPTVETDYPYLANPYGVGIDEPDGKWDMSTQVAPDRADDAVGWPYDWEFWSNPELCAQRLPGTVLFGIRSATFIGASVSTWLATFAFYSEVAKTSGHLKLASLMRQRPHQHRNCLCRALAADGADVARK